MRERIVAMVLVMSAAAVAAGGCFFEPREPAAPSGVTRVYLPRGEAKNIIANIDRAFEYRDAGGYRDFLSEEFRYDPDGQTLVEYPDVDWANWGKEQEIAFASNLFGRVERIEMALPDSVIFEDSPSGNRVTWDYIYFIRVFEGGSETRYRGRAQFELVQEGSFWYLARWEDLNGEADPEGGILPTMGALRGAIAGQTR